MRRGATWRGATSRGAMPISLTLALAIACAASAAACSSAKPAAASNGTAKADTVIPPRKRPATPEELEAQRLARLEREARALAKTAGCAGVQACRTAPVGSRGCGGPRTYLVYCAATTDTVALFAKLHELEQAEQDYNARAGIASTCEMRLPMRVTLDGGRCVGREGRPTSPLEQRVP